MKNSDSLQLAKTPLIGVEVYHTSTHVTKIVLVPSESGFYCRFFSTHKASLQEAVLDWLKLYSQGKRGPSLPLLWNNLSPFSEKVLQEMSQVPFGSKISYKDLAKKALNPKAARAVGNVCRANPFPLVIPCHRVISSQGKIGNFAFGQAMKEDLLLFEGSLRR